MGEFYKLMNVWRNRIATILFFTIAVSFVRADDDSSTLQIPHRGEADALVRRYLPIGSQHTFFSYPSTRPAISYMKLLPESFQTVANPNDAEKLELYKSVRYSPVPPNATANGAVKQLIFYPNGSVYSETDATRDEVFDRQYFPDGTLREYTHWRSRKWIAGLAIDRQTKNSTFFAEGSGSLTIGDDFGSGFVTEHYAGGDLYLVDQRWHPAQPRMALSVGNDCLTVTKSGEILCLLSRHEYWTRSANGSLAFQFLRDMDPKTRQSLPIQMPGDVRELIGGNLMPSDIAQIENEWKIAYPKRRSEFLARFDQTIRPAGSTWQTLGIDFVRKDVSWPGP